MLEVVIVRIGRAALASICLLVAGPLLATNAISNATFDTGVTGWTVAPGATATFSSLDVRGSAASGSALVTLTDPAVGATAGISQCVPGTGGPYHLGFRWRLPDGTKGSISARVEYFTNATCDGNPANADGDTYPNYSGGTWRDFGVNRYRAPNTTKSIRVNLHVARLAAGESSQAYFDDVFLNPISKELKTVPASASIHGQNGAFFHTDLWIYNPSMANMSVGARHRCFAGQTCGDATREIYVPPRGSVLLEDVLAVLFTDPESAGAIELTYDAGIGEIQVLTRTYTPSLPSPTFGSAIPAVESGDARTSLVLLGLAGSGGTLSTGFRTNVGVYNPNGAAANLTFQLFAGSGALLGSFERVATAYEPLQVNDVFAAAGAGGTVTRNAFLVVTADRPVFAYGTVVDNQTNDSSYVAARPAD